MDTTPAVEPTPLRHRALPNLPLWQIQLIQAANDMADEHTEHTDHIDGDGCDACYWQALYDNIPGNYRRAVLRDIAAGIPAAPIPLAARG